MRPSRSDSRKHWTSGWKQKLADECFRRLNRSRAELLERSRAGGRNTLRADLSSLINATNQQLQQHQHNAPDASMLACTSSAGETTPVAAPTPGGAVSSMASTQDAEACRSSCTQPNASWPATNATPPHPPSVSGTIGSSPFSCGRRPAGGGGSGWLHTLDGAEYEELMLRLERGLYEDQLLEEEAVLRQAEQADQAELDCIADSYYQAQQQQQAGGPGGVGGAGGGAADAYGGGGVLCPLCRSCCLLQHKGVIVSHCRQLRIDVGVEGLGLADLQDRLAQVLEVHSQSGCQAQPSFSMQVVGGTSSLCLACPSCRAYEVVM